MTMKAGLTISIILHIVVLGWGALFFSYPIPFDTAQTEPLPVSLAPLADKISAQKGEKKTNDTRKPAPKPTEKPQNNPDAENIGESEVDTKIPFNPQEKPREVETAPVSSSATSAIDDKRDDAEFLNKPDTGKERTAKIRQQKTEATEKKPEKQTTTEPVLPEQPPLPDTRPQSPSRDVAEPGREQNNPFSASEEGNQTMSEPALPEQPPLPDARPQIPSEKAEPERKKKNRESLSPTGEKTVEDILAMADHTLVDKTRTAGGGAKHSQEPASSGARKNIGDSAFQQTLNNIIGSCIKQNWNLAAIQGSTAYDLRVVAHFRLDRNGTLQGEPDMMPAGGDTTQREIIAIQAREALKKCAPFSLPADKYNQWHDVTVNMKAFPD